MARLTASPSVCRVFISLRCAHAPKLCLLSSQEQSRSRTLPWFHVPFASSASPQRLPRLPKWMMRLMMMRTLPPDLLGSDSDSDSDSDEDADATTHHCAPAIQVSPGQLIHQRCAHVSDTYLYTAVREGIVVGLRLPPRPSRFVYPFCDACALAKSTNTASTRTIGSKQA